MQQKQQEASHPQRTGPSQYCTTASSKEATAAGRCRSTRPQPQSPRSTFSVLASFAHGTQVVDAVTTPPATGTEDLPCGGQPQPGPSRSRTDLHAAASQSARHPPLPGVTPGARLHCAAHALPGAQPQSTRQHLARAMVTLHPDQPAALHSPGGAAAPVVAGGLPPGDAQGLPPPGHEALRSTAAVVEALHGGWSVARLAHQAVDQGGPSCRARGPVDSAGEARGLGRGQLSVGFVVWRPGTPMQCRALGQNVASGDRNRGSVSLLGASNCAVPAATAQPTQQAANVSAAKEHQAASSARSSPVQVQY
jgi:hypothetical protein